MLPIELARAAVALGAMIEAAHVAAQLIEIERRHFRDQPVILVWDGLPAHRSCLMKTYLQSQRRWLKEERLPGYAPNLNPVETLWSNIKGPELANRCSANLTEAATAACQGIPASAIKPSNSRFPFSIMPVFLFDQNVTVLCEVQ